MSAVNAAIAQLTEVSVEAVKRSREIVDAVLTRVSKRRRARIEAELDAKQDKLRHTILRLAHALGAEAHDARRALIRESFLASGKVPSDPHS